MNDSRPKTEQPNEQTTPNNPVGEPSKGGIPTKPFGTNPQPKTPDASGNPSRIEDPKDSARVPTQAKR